MRGDSIRDLYAKTVALLGLGVLAGTGALVDYWPSSQVQLPGAEPVLAMPEAAWVALPAAPVRPAVRLETPAPVPAPVAEPDAPVLRLIPAASLGGGTGFLTLSAPPPDVLTPVSWVAANHTEIALSEFEAFASDSSAAGFDTATTLSASVTENDDWWITGAFKRTGSSLARTGARTKASFVDMFRAVNRAVRRALPD